jgi:hypothetical protein
VDPELQGEKMSGPFVDLTFPHAWEAQILSTRPLILPSRHFVYPTQVEEVERGAMEVMVHPNNASEFLATCALGFRDPTVPSGVWSAPNPEDLCAVSGGYTYILHTGAPDRFSMIPYRPVLQVLPAPDAGLLLFVGHRGVLAWGADGHAWESDKLSDEGVMITGIDGTLLRGSGWNMFTDKETPFALDLRTGRRMA